MVSKKRLIERCSGFFPIRETSELSPLNASGSNNKKHNVHSRSSAKLQQQKHVGYAS